MDDAAYYSYFVDGSLLLTVSNPVLNLITEHLMKTDERKGLARHVKTIFFLILLDARTHLTWDAG